MRARRLRRRPESGKARARGVKATRNLMPIVTLVRCVIGHNHLDSELRIPYGINVHVILRRGSLSKVSTPYGRYMAASCTFAHTHGRRSSFSKLLEILVLRTETSLRFLAGPRSRVLAGIDSERVFLINGTGAIPKEFNIPCLPPQKKSCQQVRRHSRQSVSYQAPRGKMEQRVAAS